MSEGKFRLALALIGLLMVGAVYGWATNNQVVGLAADSALVGILAGLLLAN